MGAELRFLNGRDMYVVVMQESLKLRLGCSDSINIYLQNVEGIRYNPTRTLWGRWRGGGWGAGG